MSTLRFYVFVLSILYIFQPLLVLHVANNSFLFCVGHCPDFFLKSKASCQSLWLNSNQFPEFTSRFYTSYCSFGKNSRSGKKDSTMSETSIPSAKSEYVDFEVGDHHKFLPKNVRLWNLVFCCVMLQRRVDTEKRHRAHPNSLCLHRVSPSPYWRALPTLQKSLAAPLFSVL